MSADLAKAIETLVYVAERCGNIYHALKVIYFADREHLSKYGRLIYGDEYVAMNYGPVPSLAYDLVKTARGDVRPHMREYASLIAPALSADDHTITARRGAQLEFLSETDVECLDSALSRYGHLTFRQLKNISHDDPAWKASDENSLICIETLARSLPNGSAVLEYLRDC